MWSAQKGIEQYAEDSPIFYLGIRESDLGPLPELVKAPVVRSILEMGCGDGNLALFLKSRGLLEHKEMRCVDLSATRLARLREASDGSIQTHQASVETLEGVPSSAFDLVISQMVIEHVDDAKFVAQASRVLREGGWLYLTTIFKKPWAWYFYKNHLNETVIDPTHLREYTEDAQLLRILESAGFRLVSTRKWTSRYTLATLLFRVARKLTKNERLAGHIAKKMLWARVPIVGYYGWELVLKK